MANAWSPDRWQRINAVLDAVMDLSEAERTAQIEKMCGEDDQLAREVLEFLAEAERSNGFMEKSAGETAASLVAHSTESWQPESRLGQNLGPYELTEILGEGGMGVVYGARRSDGQYDAEVAIKLMLAISADHPLRAHFLAERQILARLDHPGIASLFDGGLDPEGHPYIVMEKVVGCTLLEHCAQADLTERLDLFIEVCSVVAAAHRRMVLHCDLKPSNILVTAEGDLKLLDFGLARWLDNEKEGADAELRLKMYTPGYASPEQLNGEPLSTASDVYSLGVLLRELIDGPHRWTKHLQGDLGNILAQATAESPGERYGTADELATDLRRYQDRLPVRATPPTLWYRFGKLVDRNRGATVALALVAALITTGVTATLWQARIAATERDVARLEAAHSAAVTDFLVGLFESSDPVTNKGADVTAREVLEQGATQIAGLAGQPALQAQLQYVMADVFFNLGEFDQATALYRASLENRIQNSGSQSRDATNTQLALGVSLLEAGQHEEAEEQLQACLEARRNQISADPTWVSMPLRALARLRCEQMQYVEAVAIFEEARALEPAATAVATDDLGRYYNNFAVALKNVGRLAEADSTYGLAEQAYLQTLPAHHPHFAALYNNWALVVNELDQNSRAEILHRRALDFRRQLKHNRVDIGISLINLGNLLVNMDRADEAVPLLEEAVMIQREAFGTKHLYVGAAIINLGLARLSQGEAALAAAQFREGYDIFVEVFGTDNPAVAIALARRAQAARALGNPEQALALLEQSITTHRPHLPTYRVRFADSVFLRGQVFTELDRVDEARSDLQEAAEIFRDIYDADHAQNVAAQQALAALPR